MSVEDIQLDGKQPEEGQATPGSNGRAEAPAGDGQDGATPVAQATQPAQPNAEVISLPPVELKPDLYFNRELSLLEFHARVLEEAMDAQNPLLERLRFLSIFNSNLEEFFMIRVSGIREQLVSGVAEHTPDGLSPIEKMAVLRHRILPLLGTQSTFYSKVLKPALTKEGIAICDYAELSTNQKRAAQDYFERMVFPVCTPLAVDPGHPFPHISNLSLNLGVELQDPAGKVHFARVKVPNVLPRLVQLPAEPHKQKDKKREPVREPIVFTWLEQVLSAHLGALFPQMMLLEVHPFRVIRDVDLEIQEMEANDLLESVEESLSRRRFGQAVAILTNPGMPERVLSTLTENMQLMPGDVYVTEGALGMADLSEVYQRVDRQDLKFAPLDPHIPTSIRSAGNILYAIQQGDILLHHPFDSFGPVIDFIRTAAADPDVLAIKQTLYRVGSHSPIVEALLEAAEAGKQVAVLVELKARGDEESNIEWARALEQAGVHVTYGLIGLKTHCKLAMVVRREGDGIRRYCHLGTGNYNQGTARGYTDMGLFTANPEIGADVTELFNYLTGYSKQTQYRKLLVAPVTMRGGILALIEREIKRHRENGDGHIIFKVNHLVDPAIIQALYRASQYGVRIDLIVRGMCSLRPGVPGVSENIKVTRLVGRFLEHHRIFWFHNGGKDDMLMGSADMMQRNLDRRVEAMFPIEDEAIRNHVRREVLDAYMRDNAQTSVLQRDGTYVRRKPKDKEPRFDAQASFIKAGNEAEMTVSLAALPKRYRKHLSRYGRSMGQGMTSGSGAV